MVGLIQTVINCVNMSMCFQKSHGLYPNDILNAISTGKYGSFYQESEYFIMFCCASLKLTFIGQIVSHLLKIF